MGARACDSPRGLRRKSGRAVACLKHGGSKAKAGNIELIFLISFRGVVTFRSYQALVALSL